MSLICIIFQPLFEVKITLISFFFPVFVRDEKPDLAAGAHSEAGGQ